MQEIITWIVIVAALVFLVINLVRVLKMFRKPDPCRGCGNACDKCPIFMGNNKES